MIKVANVDLTMPEDLRPVLANVFKIEHHSGAVILDFAYTLLPKDEEISEDDRLKTVRGVTFSRVAVSIETFLDLISACTGAIRELQTEEETEEEEAEVD